MSLLDTVTYSTLSESLKLKKKIHCLKTKINKIKKLNKKTVFTNVIVLKVNNGKRIQISFHLAIYFTYYSLTPPSL